MKPLRLLSGQRPLFVVECPFCNASEVECVTIRKPEILNEFEQAAFADFPNERKMPRCRIGHAGESSEGNKYAL